MESGIVEITEASPMSEPLLVNQPLSKMSVKANPSWSTEKQGETDRKIREAIIYQDLAFKKAVLAARRAGLERVTLGVRVDESPIPPSYKRYDVSTPSVLTQSVAGECTDQI